MFASTRVTRRRFLGLSGMAVAAAVLGACAQPTPTPAPPKVEPTRAQAATEPTQAPAPEPTTAPPAELLYLFAGTPPKDQELVQDEMNKILKERINATITLQQDEYDSYAQKMIARQAAGEKYDLCFTSSWLNPYYPNVANGVLLDITDLLPVYAPQFYSALNPGAWDATRVKGRIYATPNEQIWASAWGAIARKDMAEKYGLDLSRVNRVEDMEPWFDAVAKGEAGKVTPIRSGDDGSGGFWVSHYWDLDDIDYQAFVYMNDQDLKLRHLFELPEHTACMEMARRFYQAGYYTREPIPAGEMIAATRAGKYAFRFHVAKPGVEAEEKAATGFEHVAKILDKGYLTTGNIIATMTAVGHKSPNPEAAVRYLELVNTDKPFYNLLCKGIEGKHWVWADQAREIIGFAPGLDAQTSPYNPGLDWMFGNQFNAYYVDETQVGAWDAMRKLNGAATPSPLMGFVPDWEPIKNEVAAIKAAGAEYKYLGLGLLDPAKTLPAYEAALKANGLDKVIAELQRQVDEWKAAS